MVPQQCIASESVERKFSIINGQLDRRRQWGRDGGGGRQEREKRTRENTYLLLLSLRTKCTGVLVQRTGTTTCNTEKKEQHGEFNHQPRSTGCERVGREEKGQCE